MDNFILEYYKKIKSKQVIVGTWIKNLYEKITKGLEIGEYIFDNQKADKAINFIEKYCHHCEGRNDLLKLELWQKALVSLIFGIVENDGTRVFREVVVIMAKKQGKTLLASAIIAYMAYVDGEYGAKIFCVATKIDQASIVYNDFIEIVKSNTQLKTLSKKRRSDIYIEKYNTSVKPIAFSVKTSEGLNPHLVICDEIASWAGAAGLMQYETLKSATSSRKQPLLLSISTAGYLNDGIYDELIKRGTAWLKGGSKEHRLLPVFYIIDDAKKWNNISELKKASPNLNVSVTEKYIKEEITIAKSSLSKRAEFLMKYCNLKQNNCTAWLSYQDIEKICGGRYELADFKNCYCVGGIDLSQTTDLTACSIIIEKNEKLFIFCKFFMPRNRIQTMQSTEGVPYEIFVKRGIIVESGENFVNYKDCYDWFVELVEKYKIYPLKIGYDRYSSQYLVNDLQNRGFQMDDVYQGENLSPVIKEFEGVLKDKNLQIGENDLLKSHFLNVALKENLETRKNKPVKINQRSHIDGFVSVIDALTVRQKWYSEIGIKLKNEVTTN